MSTNESIAIYHNIKISTAQQKKKVQREAKVADLYIGDVETKFEYMLFNAPKELSYMDLYIYFKHEWERMLNNLDRRKFKYIKINRNHFANQYLPK